MQMPKPTEADRARFAECVPDDRRVTSKPMFGNVGAFVNGNMFMGLFGPDIGVKLASADMAELLALPGAGPFGPAGRPMSGYATMPAAFDAPTARAWAQKALEHVAELPAKSAKSAKSAPKSSKPRAKAK